MFRIPGTNPTCKISSVSQHKQNTSILYKCSSDDIAEMFFLLMLFCRLPVFSMNVVAYADCAKFRKGSLLKRLFTANIALSYCLKPFCHWALNNGYLRKLCCVKLYWAVLLNRQCQVSVCATSIAI